LPSVIPHAVLGVWLVPETASGAGFEAITHSEADRPDDLAEQLAAMIAAAKCNLDTLRRLLKRVGWLKASARLAPSKRVAGRHGDFGEVLAIGLLESFAGVHVPVVKLRTQTDPEQSLHGADVVGFHLSLGTEGQLVVHDLEFVETKCRTSRDKQQAAKAHQQLADDRDAQFADTIEFLLLKLEELGNLELLEAYESFLASREGDLEGRYRITLIFDEEVWMDDELAELPDPHELCTPLTVEVVLVEGLADLIEATWQAVPQLALAE
jgi:hypothetical protein